MKLRNKKTGEIRDFIINKDKIQTSSAIDCWVYNSLAELNTEWEDTPEDPKGMWAVGEFGELYEVSGLTLNRIKELEEIGNCFSSEEKAEKAVEKLKAWKRLKDKGFRFIGIAGNSNNIYVGFETDNKYRSGHVMYDEYTNTDNKLKEYNEDLDLLFGCEDE